MPQCDGLWLSVLFLYLEPERERYFRRSIVEDLWSLLYAWWDDVKFLLLHLAFERDRVHDL